MRMERLKQIHKACFSTLALMLLLPWPAIADTCPLKTSLLVKRQHKASIFMTQLYIFLICLTGTICLCACACVCVYIHIHVCVCVHMYIHNYI